MFFLAVAVAINRIINWSNFIKRLKGRSYFAVYWRFFFPAGKISLISQLVGNQSMFN